MPYAEINGARLCCEQHGSGPEAVVLAHGLLMRREMYAAQIAALQSRYRCVAFDFRGHGDSESTRGGYSVDGFTEDAAAVIRALDCAPCHFVGHSLGGFVGLRLALRHPDLIRSLVLVNSTGAPERPDQIARYRLLNRIARLVGFRPVIGQVLPIMFGRAFLGDPARAGDRARWRALLLSNDRHGVTHSAQAVIDRDGIEDRLSEIDVPTLVITGSDDRAIPPARSRAMHEAIPNSRFVELPRAGHTTPVEQPDAVADILRDFFHEVSSPRDSQLRPHGARETV